jgi:GDPmannose 4,6-dehydratase
MNLLDQRSIAQALERFQPAEIYNLAAKHPASSQSLQEPILTGEMNGIAVLRLLEAVRSVNPSIRFCQASTAQIYGNPTEAPQTEDTPFRPNNPYSIAKLYAQWIITHYRDAHALFACSAILFNHESPRRAEKFVTRKITVAVARIRAGLQDRLSLASLDARRDWGYAPDYMRAMWRMLQMPAADDYVLATGETHSVREFCKLAFAHAGLEFERYVTQDSEPVCREDGEVDLVGDARKARRRLDWSPSITFEELVRMMVDADLEQLARNGR